MFDYYGSDEGGAFLLRQTAILIAGALALCAVFGDGRLDFTIASLFFDDAQQVFPLANHWLFKDLMHDTARTASASAALVLCGVTAIAWTMPRGKRLAAWRGELLLAAGASLTAAAAVGVLKHFSAHACPWDLAAFGGTAPYHGLLSASGAGGPGRGCFPAAHPLTGYAWLAVGFALYPLAARAARHWWAAAFALGTLFGAVQVARGAHFPSHVLWSAWVAWAVNVALLTLCVRLPQMRAARSVRPSAASLTGER
jgi:membrane-associated PAP2 superfamily phosphatase